TRPGKPKRPGNYRAPTNVSLQTRMKSKAICMQCVLAKPAKFGMGSRPCLPWGVRLIDGLFALPVLCDHAFESFPAKNPRHSRRDEVHSSNPKEQRGFPPAAAVSRRKAVPGKSCRGFFCRCGGVYVERVCLAGGFTGYSGRQWLIYARGSPLR